MHPHRSPWPRSRPMPRGIRLATTGLLGLALALAGCGDKVGEKVGDMGKTVLGEGGSVVTGSAGPAGAHGAARELVRCDAPVATVALAENPYGYTVGASYQLPASPVPLVRLLAQQSGCFRVVDRAVGLRGTVQEQELRAQGVLRQGGTVQGGAATRRSSPSRPAWPSAKSMRAAVWRAWWA